MRCLKKQHRGLGYTDFFCVDSDIKYSKRLLKYGQHKTGLSLMIV